MSTASRRKKAGKAPKKPPVRRASPLPAPDTSTGGLPRASRQAPLISAARAQLIEARDANERYIRSLMRPDHIGR